MTGIFLSLTFIATRGLAGKTIPLCLLFWLALHGNLFELANSDNVMPDRYNGLECFNVFAINLQKV